jgi:branched-chain amino acid transport system ATP-binding protein
VISGLESPSRGSILLESRELIGRSVEEMVRQGISLVPEGRQIFAQQTVLANLRLGAYLRLRKLRKEDISADLGFVFRTFPILNQRKQQIAGTLSGGEQQMLAMGRGLMANPKLLLLDEPSTGLAPLVVEEIFKILRSLNEGGLSILLVEQNTRVALDVAKRGYLLQTGQIVLQGSARDLLHQKEVEEIYLGERLKKRGE